MNDLVFYNVGCQEPRGARRAVVPLAADALGLSASDLAEVLYGDDAPAARSKARLALDKHRKNREG